MIVNHIKKNKYELNSIIDKFLRKVQLNTYTCNSTTFDKKDDIQFETFNYLKKVKCATKH